MSTREMAISIIDGMTEEQREAFVVMFGGHIPKETESAAEVNDLDEKRKAFLEIKKMRKKAPDDFDYKKELMEYLDERYGS